MSELMRVTGDDFRYLSTQLNALADELHGAPLRGVGGAR